MNQNATPRRLNGLVTELLGAEVRLGAGESAEHTFTNPRKGWVFVAVRAAQPKDTPVRVVLTSEEGSPTIIEHVGTGGDRLEAMRLLPAGEHKLVVSADNAVAATLVVRAIPALGHCRYGYDPRVPPYGPYDWPYLEKHVTPHVNYLVGSGTAEQNRTLVRWRAQGKQCLIECGAPGLVNAPDVELTGEAAYQYWTRHEAFTNPLIDGGLADEFLAKTPKAYYEAWTEGVRKLHADERLRDKRLYPYCTGTIVELEHCRKFVEAVIETGGKIAWERYQEELPTEAEARAFIESEVKDDMMVWEQHVPGCRRHMILVLGYLCMMTAETQSVDPNVDFKYYLDMQCHMIANDPAFEGLYGLQTYTSGYTDDETMRWMYRLFRHYFIEGNTEMLSERYGFTYRVDHLTNPDFVDGTDGWVVESAERGSVTTKSHPGYGRMQGRMGSDRGDEFLWTRRSERMANIICQQAVGLVPGKLYSLKLVTADYGELKAGKSTEAIHPVSVTIDGVTMIDDKSFVWAQPNLYCRFLPPFSETNNFWFNHHHYVFEAQAETAMVTIKDWRSDSDPGGPAGQELMYNFAELQPYFAE